LNLHQEDKIAVKIASACKQALHDRYGISTLKTKHMLERQSGEQEMKALKDEIRSLHVS
jgi:hypothetical protein